MKSLIIAALAGVIAATTGGSTPSGQATVDVKTFQFSPDTLRVKTGTHVTWTNRDEIEHTVTAGTPDKRGTSFNRSLGTKGASYEVTFDRPGTYTYFCDRHQFMRGVITVTR
jgi:plastocyanin